jgi:CubicO group peptidase (beta-lactamase class C family)
MSAPGTVIGTSISGNRTITASGLRSTLDRETPLLMQPDTSFDLASLTKIVATTSTIMTLVSEKEIGIYDRVSKFLPAWNSSEKCEISIRHLLEHRSGLWEWRPLYISVVDPDGAHNLIATSPLRYGVNTERHYSDLGFITLGAVITRIMGKDLVECVNELSLNKFSLTSTSFSSPRNTDNVAATSRGDRYEKAMVDTKIPYPVSENADDFKDWRSGIISGEVNDGNAFHVFNGVASHAGIFSNANDLLQFGESLLELPEFENFCRDGVDPDFHLGFRSWVDTFDACSARFYGHTGFTGVAILVSPAHESAMTMLTNRLHTDMEIVPTEMLLMPYLKEFHAKFHTASN